MSEDFSYIPDPALLEVARKHLIASFDDASEHDYEDYASEAYAVMLKKARAGGEKPMHPKALIKTIAFRLMKDARSKRRSAVHRAAPTDPHGAELTELAGSEDADPLARIDLASRAVRANAVLENLEPRERAAFKCRFGLNMTNPEGAKACGVSMATFKRHASKGYTKTTRLAEGREFSELQRKAVSLYYREDLADDHWAYKMVHHDPATHALYVALQRRLRREAGTINLDTELRVLAAATGSLSLAAILHALRAKLSGEAAATGAQSSGAMGGAAGGGGLLAAGAGTKTIAACGLAALCVGGGIAVKHDGGGAKEKETAMRTRSPQPPQLTSPPASAPVDRSEAPAPSRSGGNGGGSSDSGGGGKKSGKQDKNDSTPPAGAPAPADAAANEFDPLAAPPAPAPATPAPPPPSSSGGSSSSSSSGGGTTDGSIAGSEFGP